ncbi:MAG: RpiB/LacA/LacB family sugar-phosphate isomerase [Patescibacteria group bacterium]
MTVFIGADHGGFEMKNALIDYLHEKDIRVEDLGAYELIPDDDYPDYAKKVAQAVLQNPNEFVGIVVCRSGVGVDITVNRFDGIRCVLGFDETEVQKAKEDDNVNVLALPADYVDLEKAQKLVEAFLDAVPKSNPKYQRRIEKIDE